MKYYPIIYSLNFLQKQYICCVTAHARLSDSSYVTNYPSKMRKDRYIERILGIKPLNQHFPLPLLGR